MDTRIPPLKTLYGAGVIAFCALVISLLIAAQLPRIGIELTSDDHKKLVIEKVFSNSPAARAGLKAGDILVAIAPDRDSPFALDANAIVIDPDIFPNHDQFNGFLSKQSIVNEIITSNSFYLVINNQEFIPINETTHFKALWLPSWSWWMLGLGSCIFLLAISILAHDTSNPSARHLFLTGIGLWLASLFYAIYGSRELASFAPNIFYTLICLKHLSLSLFAWGGISLLWHYPKPMGMRKLYVIFTSLMIMSLCANSFQLFELPVHTYYFLPYVIPTAFGIFISFKQYLASRSSPVDRAIMLWFSSAIWISVIAVYIFHILPTLYYGEPTSNIIVQCMFFLLFVGFGFGVTKFRLFDIDRWWFNTWLLFFLALSILAVDTLVVLLWNESGQHAFSLALLICFWGYFPLREKLWRITFRGKQHYDVNDYLAEMVSAFNSSDYIDNREQAYIKVFSVIFKPAHQTIEEFNDGFSTQPTIKDNGLKLIIPLLHKKQLCLTGKHLGSRLFDSRDKAFTVSTLNMIKKIIDLNQEKLDALSRERSRIMRDLHDDVGARLLNLIHGTKDQKAIAHAQDTMNALRLSVIPLHSNNPRCLIDSIDDWHNETLNRLQDLEVSSSFNHEIPAGYNLGIREYINITKIIRELISNMIKHSQSKHLACYFTARNKMLELTMDQIGNSHTPTEFHNGTGLNNIDTRLTEIFGSISSRQLIIKDQISLRYRITIPLEKS